MPFSVEVMRSRLIHPSVQFSAALIAGPDFPARIND
jgi:hypothetical protein